MQTTPGMVNAAQGCLTSRMHLTDQMPTNRRSRRALLLKRMGSAVNRAVGAKPEVVAVAVAVATVVAAGARAVVAV